jgi:hypothetical protein
VDGTATPEHEYNHYITNNRRNDLIPRRKGLYYNG